MKISDLFYQYLIKYQSLNIEGFGKFDIEKTEAYVHPIDHEISPSNLKLNFRLDKNTIDSGFNAFISEKFSVDLAIASKMLKGERDEWVNLLKSGKEVNFNFIGNLKVNTGGTVIFVQTPVFSLDKSSFGLTSFKMEPIGPQPTEPTNSIIPKVKNEKRKSHTFLWLAAASLVIILSAGVWIFGDSILGNFKSNLSENTSVNPRINSDSISKTNENIVDNQKIESDTIIDTLASTEYIDTIQETSTTPPIQKSETTTETDQGVINQNASNQYIVVAGCFRDQKLAENYLTTLKNKGYSASIEGITSNGLIRVCSGTYASVNEATIASNAFNSKENKSSWIQKR